MEQGRKRGVESSIAVLSSTGQPTVRPGGQGLCLAQRRSPPHLCQETVLSLLRRHAQFVFRRAQPRFPRNSRPGGECVAILSIPPALHPPQGSPTPQSTPQSVGRLTSAPLNCHYRCVHSHSDRKWVLLIFVPPEPSMVPSLNQSLDIHG